MSDINILVIGSTGKLGKCIVMELLNHFDSSNLYLSDYKYDRLKKAKHDILIEHNIVINSRVIDATDEESIRDGIDEIDVVVIAMSQKEPLIQRVCIEEGATSLDLSVNPHFLADALKLDNIAIEKKSLALLTCGLFPGFSGVLAKSREYEKDKIIDIGLIQNVNGKAGPTGVADMLELFSEKVTIFNKGKKTTKRGFSYKKLFNSQNNEVFNVRLASFIERDYLFERHNIKANYWSGFNSESFNKMIGFLNRVYILKLFKIKKIRVKLGKLIVKLKTIRREDEQITVFIGYDGVVKSYVFESDYKATAYFTRIFIQLLRNIDIDKYGVLFPMDILWREDIESIIVENVS